MQFIALFCLVVVFLGNLTTARELKYHRVGCFKDSMQQRALPDYLGTMSSIECAKAAYIKGFKVFGMQFGGECWTGDGKYDMYGSSDKCRYGNGGSEANDIYIIDGYKDQCPDTTGYLPNEKVKSTCKTLKEHNSKMTSGIYWINPTGTHAFQAYCDMETAGGGWTLVYSYTFTNYRNFRSGSNAITPQPNWPGVGSIPRSTTPPLGENDYNAMDFALWKIIGKKYMIKTNINHWIECSEGSGSLVNWKTGSIHCKVVKNIAHKCHNYVPDQIKFVAAGSRGRDLGPDMIRTSSRSRLKEYYYLEAETNTGNWPTHDPCGTNSQNNHLRNVANPHGNIYIY